MMKRLKSWENWPFELVYLPLALAWGWYMLRSRSVWFFTPSNPGITFGGLEGEPKDEMYLQLPRDLYPPTVFLDPALPFEEAMAAVQGAGLAFPVVAKPNVGLAGLLFRKVDNFEQLRAYHLLAGVPYMVQAFVDLPMEMSVFYYRYPGQQHGVITGLLHKVPMHVVGNGKDTLEQLVWAHAKAARRVEELRSGHEAYWHEVIPDGERYPLSYAANHNRGAHFINLNHEIDGRLLAVFDKLSHEVGSWFYGRWDLMCHSLEDLKNGTGFVILEYNGCGAEPNHIYDSGYSLGAAYREILRHWKALYEISRENRRQGVAPWPFRKGLRFLREAKQHKRYLETKDKALSF